MAERHAKRRPEGLSNFVFNPYDGYSYEREATLHAVSKAYHNLLKNNPDLPEGATIAAFSPPGYFAGMFVHSQAGHASAPDQLFTGYYSLKPDFGGDACPITLQPLGEGVAVFMSGEGRAFSLAGLSEALENTVFQGKELRLVSGRTLRPTQLHTVRLYPFKGRDSGSSASWRVAISNLSQIHEFAAKIPSSPIDMARKVKYPVYDPKVVRSLSPAGYMQVAMVLRTAKSSDGRMNVQACAKELISRGVVGTELHADAHTVPELVISNIKLRGAHIFPYHGKGDASIVFRNVKFKRCLIGVSAQACLCGTEFIGCLFKDCMFPSSGRGSLHSLHLLACSASVVNILRTEAQVLGYNTDGSVYSRPYVTADKYALKHSVNERLKEVSGLSDPVLYVPTIVKIVSLSDLEEEEDGIRIGDVSFGDAHLM